VILAKNRKVFAFGDNTSGALGNNATADSAYAVNVLKSTTAGDHLGDCKSVAAGMDFAMALGSDGSVYTWGKRANGRLGDGGTLGSRKYAEKVEVTSTTFLGGIASIAAGEGFGLARENNSTEQANALGRVWAWGQGTNGQLGDGATNNRNRAVLVTIAGVALDNAWEVSAGEAHSAILRWKANTPDLDGTVWTFGQQQYGRLGNNQPGSGNISTPAVVRKLSDGTILTKIVSVVCGSAHTLALDENGNVWAWGYNGKGALGDNTIIDRSRAVLVKGPGGIELGGVANLNPDDDIIRIGAGGVGTENFSMAVARNGKLYMWGWNGNGQLGNGTTTQTSVPTEVSGMALLPLVPQVSLSLAISEPDAPGRATVTANPTHGAQAGSSIIEKVELYLNGQNVATCYPPNWKATLTALATGDHHLYGIASDLNGKSAMSHPILFEIGQPAVGDPNADPDGDGLTTAEEQLLGSDPLRASFSGLPGNEVYSYDALDRLIGVSGARSHTFELDAAGNINKAN
jgi:alpha-tubulin suppressor-like RCC1 family protein